MTLVNGYTDVETLRTRFRIEDALDDPVLESVIGAVSRLEETYCERVFYDVDDEVSARRFRADTARKVTVDDFHTSTGLIVKTDEAGEGTFETTWATTDYDLEPAGGVRDGQPGWPYETIEAADCRYFPRSTRRRRLVQVTARWGWAAVPDLVSEACLLQASRLFKRKDSPLGVAGAAEFGVMRVLSKLDPDVELMLNPYRKNPVKVGG